MSEDDNNIKMTVDVVNEPVGTVEAVPYSDVMDYLHSIYILREDKERIAKRLTLEVTQPALADAYERLDHFSLLKKDWDGRGALPISHRVIGNVRKVLMISDNDDWEKWMMSPDVNATLCLYAPKTKASISLGSREFSYYARKNGERLGESHVAFTAEGLLDVMRKLSVFDIAGSSVAIA